jgi:ParB-like chromosome segregation protein Spo0J
MPDTQIKILYGQSRKITELYSWKDNPNEMTEKEARDLINSVKTFGVVEPIVIDEENMVIGGNHRCGAIMEVIGPDADVPCTVIEGLTKEQKNKLGLALNKIHGNTDDAKLKILIESFEEPEELIHLGFDEEGLMNIDIDLTSDWAKESEEPLFEAPREIQKKPVKCPQCGHEFIPEKEKGNVGRKKYKEKVLG